MKSQFKRILYGGDYNPNQWPREIWEEDMLSLIHILMLVATFVCVYPFWYIVIYTFSDSAKAGINSPIFLPRGFSVSNYADIFKLSGFFPALGISVLRTVGGTIAAVLV